MLNLFYHQTQKVLPLKHYNEIYKINEKVLKNFFLSVVDLLTKYIRIKGQTQKTD